MVHAFPDNPGQRCLKHFDSLLVSFNYLDISSTRFDKCYGNTFWTHRVSSSSSLFLTSSRFLLIGPRSATLVASTRSLQTTSCVQRIHLLVLVKIQMCSDKFPHTSNHCRPWAEAGRRPSQNGIACNNCAALMGSSACFSHLVDQEELPVIFC